MADLFDDRQRRELRARADLDRIEGESEMAQREDPERFKVSFSDTAREQLVKLASMTEEDLREWHAKSVRDYAASWRLVESLKPAELKISLAPLPGPGNMPGTVTILIEWPGEKPHFFRACQVVPLSGLEKLIDSTLEEGTPMHDQLSEIRDDLREKGGIRVSGSYIYTANRRTEFDKPLLEKLFREFVEAKAPGLGGESAPAFSWPEAAPPNLLVRGMRALGLMKPEPPLRPLVRPSLMEMLEGKKLHQSLPLPE